MSQRPNSVLTIVVLGAATALALPAQQAGTTLQPRVAKVREPAAPSFVAFDQLVRAPVVLAESVAADAAARVPVGELRDLLIDPANGRTLLVGVRCEGDVHAIPPTAVRWNDADDQWIVAMKKDAILAAPIAKDGDLTQVGARAPDGSAGADVAVAEASARRPEAAGVPLSRIRAAGISGGETTLAESMGAVLETTSGTLAFLTFSNDARAVAVPFAACRIESRAREDMAPELVVRVTGACPAPKDMPELPGPGALAKPELRDAIYAAFGIERPAFDRRKAGDVDGR